jgi:predicted Rossmann fold flavoprotein
VLSITFFAKGGDIWYNIKKEKRKQMKEVVIIGGGASGMICAIAIKEEVKDNANVTIVERLEKMGKKLLATGNGKCNFTNMQVTPDNYNDPDFVAPSLKSFGPKPTRAFFEEMGLLTKELDAGRVYPTTEMANSVLDVLRLKIRSLKIQEHCLFECKKITPSDKQYVLESTRGERLTADYVVVATGGKAMPVLGSNGSGYLLLKPFKVKMIPPLPGLVGVKVDKLLIKGLTGLRSKVELRLFEKRNDQPIFDKRGEIIFKEDGISGIVMMEMANRIERSKANCFFTIDFLPDTAPDDLLKKLMDRRSQFGFLENSELLTGMAPKMLAYMVLKRVKIDLGGYVKNLTMRELERVEECLKKCAFESKETYDFDHAQITLGGVDTTYVDKKTMEVKDVKNMYVTGEMINVDGDCGGFNLQWAISSGMAAARSIIKKVNR